MENEAETCPRCKEPEVPQGRLLVIRGATLTIPISIMRIKFSLRIRGIIRYCPTCGFKAVQNVSLF